jgi:NADH-quinone oxidoreductase subunit L
MGIDIERTLLWIVLLPLLGAAINGVFGSRASKNLVSGVAVGSVLGAFLLSLVGFGHLLMTDEPAIRNDVYTWFSVTLRGAEVPIQVRFVMDHLSGIMTVMVTGIGTLIHVYSVGYMGDDPGYARFMTYLNLFMASMLILVLASSLPLMFVGWEGVGLCSYLLIGFWYTNPDYAAAGRKAFVVNRIGDFGVLMGTFLLGLAVVGMSTPGSNGVEAFEFANINASAFQLGREPVTLGPNSLGVSVATLGVLFLFLGCAGKSAQIPLYVWLPDAMAGPTPVSALIHAATMVTAGVYLMVRLSPVVVESPVAMTVIAIVGALTALVAASIALVQNQMKKVLAYSTVSQLGFMFAAVGMGAFSGGFFHVFTHAFFKACLFLGAGSVMHAVHAHGDADIRYLGGLKKWMPRTHWTFAISTAAIAGLPLLSGFFSKDEILLGAATWATGSPFAPWVGWLVFGILVLAATMTAFYMFRLYFRTFHGEFKGGHPPEHEGEHGHDDHGHGDHGHHAEPHESPASMTVPLIVLAVGAALVGYLGLPHAFHAPNWWSNWLTPQYEEFVHVYGELHAQDVDEAQAIEQATDAARRIPSAVAAFQVRPEGEIRAQFVHAPGWVPWMVMGLGTLAGLLGLGLAFVWYYQRNGEPAGALLQRTRALHKLLMNKWYVDEAYGATVVAFNKWLAVFAANFDRFVVDGSLARVSAFAAKSAGYVVTRSQTGAVYAYAAMFVVGLAGLGWWFTYPQPSLQRMDEDTVGSVTWSAGRGLGYQYRWDFDSDGEWEVDDWSNEAQVTHDYQSSAFFELAAIVELPPRVVSPVEVLTSTERRRELVLGYGDDPEELPLDGFVPMQSDVEGEDAAPAAGGLPTAAYRNVLRYDGRIPAERQPQPDEQGRREARLEVALYRTQDARGNVISPELVWGPEEHTVQVAEGGAFSLLVGANTMLPPSTSSDSIRIGVSLGGQQLGELEAVEAQAAPVVLVRINGARIPDNDGVRDGLVSIPVGDTVTMGAARVTAAMRVRATVEVRNHFGNKARSSETVTLRVGRQGSRTAQLDRAREENAP